MKQKIREAVEQGISVLKVSVFNLYSFAFLVSVRKEAITATVADYLRFNKMCVELYIFLITITQ